MHQALWVDRAKRCRQHNTAAEKVAVTCWGMCPRPCQKMHAHQRGEVTTTHVLLQQVHCYWGQARTHTHVRQHTVPHAGTSCKSPEPKVSHTSSTAAAASHSSPRSGAHSSPGKVTGIHGRTMEPHSSFPRPDSYTRSLRAAAVGLGELPMQRYCTTSRNARGTQLLWGLPQQRHTIRPTGGIRQQQHLPHTSRSEGDP